MCDSFLPLPCHRSAARNERASPGVADAHSDEPRRGENGWDRSTGLWLALDCQQPASCWRECSRRGGESEWEDQCDSQRRHRGNEFGGGGRETTDEIPCRRWSMKGTLLHPC